MHAVLPGHAVDWSVIFRLCAGSHVLSCIMSEMCALFNCCAEVEGTVQVVVPLLTLDMLPNNVLPTVATVPPKFA